VLRPSLCEGLQFNLCRIPSQLLEVSRDGLHLEDRKGKASALTDLKEFIVGRAFQRDRLATRV
jgi:hypothetical protein